MSVNVIFFNESILAIHSASNGFMHTGNDVRLHPIDTEQNF